jgi:carotenoid 1,2-hydratase
MSISDFRGPGALRVDAGPQGDGAGGAGDVRGAFPFDGWSPLWSGLARMAGQLPPPGEPYWPARPVARGGVGAPGRGRADGGLVRPLGERCDPFGPRFDGAVGANGYRWWYLDAESDDSRFGLTVIAFIGSVFSPYYKASGRAAPENHVSLNVALYGPRGRRWTMTERGRDTLVRDRSTLKIGPSQVHWDGEALVIDVDEVGAVLPLKTRGRIRLIPQVLGQRRFRLDPSGRHVWEPLAPRARVEVDFAEPNVKWTGQGYLDANHGSEPLEDGFADWQWSRAHLKGGETAVIYEGKLRCGDDFGMALRIDNDGNAEVNEMPAPVMLPRTGWQVNRLTRADAGHSARLRATWEDTPFYSRSALASRMFGEDVVAVHESLSLDRFRSPVVQWMLPWRMPRKM